MNILEQITEKAKERSAFHQVKTPLYFLRECAENKMRENEEKNNHLFYRALKAPGLSFICEVKKASPSKGIIANDFPWLSIAREYEAAGACAISCLTEPYWFMGKDLYLKEIAASVSIPVLRKDFTVDEYMIYEAKVLGACAVLLICSILDDRQLSAYVQLTSELGMDALVEAHTDQEIDRAVKANAKIIGVNNRNLTDFSVDIENSARLRSLIPEHTVFVAESGIQGPEDIRVLYNNKADAVLIGETMMRAGDKRKMLEYLASGIEKTSAAHKDIKL